jgi:hypothetical protein
MPRSRYGQLISFAIERDEDRTLGGWIVVDLKKGDTIAKVAARRGHPEDANLIQERNRPRGGPRSVNAQFTGRGLTTLMVPREMRAAYSFDVLAGDSPPTIVGGYAKLGILGRPERTGITTFDGYDPITMKVPIRFEAERGSDRAEGIEDDIDLLESMAGRGILGDGTGPPPIIRLSTTNSSGGVVPLIPRGYQWSQENRQGPLWRIGDLQWDEDPKDGVRRNSNGRRTRQKCDVIVQQAVTINLVGLTRSSSKRAKAKAAAKKPKSKK